ncbi:MAG: hypothetical protein WCX73_00090 [Candidatus Pacearchaeota archaeon]|jgi:hypothetical protein
MPCEHIDLCKVNRMYDPLSTKCNSNEGAEYDCGEYKRLSKANEFDFSKFIKKGLEKLFG